MRIGLQTWGSEGDVRPFLALARSLVTAGHEVKLVVADNEQGNYSAPAQQYGFDLESIKGNSAQGAEDLKRIWRAIIDAGNPIRQAELIMRHGFDPLVEPMQEAAQKLCGECDAVVGHFFVYPLAIAAEKAGVPIAKLYVVHNCLPSAHIRPPGLPAIPRWAYPLGWRVIRAALNRIFLPRINAMRRREGLAVENDVMLESWPSKVLNLVAVSPAIVDRAPDWSGQTHVCGFLDMPPTAEHANGQHEALDAFLRNGDPPVYFTFGSMMLPDPDYIGEIASIWADAVERVGCRAIFQLPWNDLSCFPAGTNVFKLERSDYRAVFPRCTAIVHHGGAGTTQACLRAGRPAVVVAHLADQFFWGQELERLGAAGKTLNRKHLTGVRLARSLHRVLPSSSMRECATRAGRAIAPEDGPRVAAALLGSHLRPEIR